MKLLLSSIPAWQIERANRIHRACQRFERLVSNGTSKAKAANKVSWYYDQAPLRSDPARQLKLAAPTLRRLFETWQLGGKVPAALKLKYRTRCPFMPAPLLVRFANFCASNRLPSVRVAWVNFSNRPQNGRAKEFSYQQVIYAFDASAFYLMQAQLKAIGKAQAKCDQMLDKAIAKITDRLSERPPRRRANLANAFEI